MKPAIKFGKLKSNRATILKYLEIFKINKLAGEEFISPRPQPTNVQNEYYAIFRLTSESKNHAYFSKNKRFVPLSRSQYLRDKSLIEFFWRG